MMTYMNLVGHTGLGPAWCMPNASEFSLREYNKESSTKKNYASGGVDTGEAQRGQGPGILIQGLLPHFYLDTGTLQDCHLLSSLHLFMKGQGTGFLCQLFIAQKGQEKKRERLRGESCYI